MFSWSRYWFGRRHCRRDIDRNAIVLENRSLVTKISSLVVRDIISVARDIFVTDGRRTTKDERRWSFVIRPSSRTYAYPYSPDQLSREYQKYFTAPYCGDAEIYAYGNSQTR
jgi:hypothetical protein